MFEKSDEQYLLRAINHNQVTLFLGSGFSTLAKNVLGKALPTGGQFAALLWDFLGYTTPYDPAATSLAELYEALLASGKSVPSILEFLSSHLLCVEAPHEYDEILKVFWSRIYTTNIDNLLEVVYKRIKSPVLEIKSFPRDELPDRDQILERIQAVYLHRINNRRNGLTGLRPGTACSLVFTFAGETHPRHRQASARTVHGKKHLPRQNTPARD